MANLPPYYSLLACPSSKEPLRATADETRVLQTETSSYPVKDGIPILIQTEQKSRLQILSPDEVELSILIMVLNEEENLPTVLSSVTEELKKLGISYELVLVDGGSTDNTVAVAEKFGATIFQQSSPGYANGLTEGFLKTRGRFVLTLDGDCSHEAALIPLLLNKRDEADLVIGSRWVKGGTFEGPWLRHQLSKLLNLTFQKILSLPIADLSSGYRLYRRECLTPLKWRSKNFSILEEILIQVYVDGFRITELPLQYRPRQHGSSHVRFASFALSYIKTLWKMWMLRNDANSADYDNRAYNSLNIVQRWWQRSRFRNIMDLLGDYKNSGEVLDVGCGSSKIIQSMPHAVAFDFSPKKLRFLQATNPKRVCGSALALPFVDNAFDCVIHSQLIEHLPMDDKIFAELQRIIKPGGTLIIGTVDYASKLWPTIEWIYGIVMPHAYADEHISHYTLTSLKEKVKEFGFQPVDERDILRGEITVKAIKAQ